MDKECLIYTKQIVENAVNEAFNMSAKLSKGNFRLFLALGDYYEIFEGTNEIPYVIENLDDIRYDTNRMVFLSHYLYNHYQNEGFIYQGENGIDCITIELMIYSQIWESDFFLKILTRLTSLSIGKEYPWKPFEKDESNWNLIHHRIIEQLNEKGLLLGNLINECYCSNIRNSFAHSIYEINENRQEINYFGFERPNQKRKRLFYPKKQYNISFKDFQIQFLKAAYLSYYLNALFIQQRNQVLSQLGSIEEIVLPNGKFAGIRVIQEFGVNRFDFELY